MNFITNFKVSTEDIDSIGHVSNVGFASFLEAAREKWYENIGLPYVEMHKDNIAPLIVKIEIEFTKEAKVGDILMIKTEPYKLGNKSFTFKQEIYNQYEDHITHAFTTIVMYDINLNETVVVIDKIARHFTSILDY